MRLRQFIIVVFISVLFIRAVHAQSPDGTISGTVYDSSGKVIAGADITVVNDATRVQSNTKTNNDGVYVLPDLPPGSYRLQVAKLGFKTLIKPDITLNVQDALAINFTLPIGSVAETVTVEGGAPLIDTQDATVSTVVDRQFAENLPMNGRSFQTLIQLTPGVVLVQGNAADGGQFSVNGQRADANYWMVDGVSANFGVGATNTPGNGTSGSLGAFSVLGGTNSLVSVDALQEFRILTSTYAPEFGRAPGGQIAIATRSGTNTFHGTLFDYLRNDVLDAGDWFNGYLNDPPLPKARERQNDFGGTLGGPILKDRTFFFFSYEGLRLSLPETSLTTVPDLAARTAASTAMQPFLNAYPVPNGPDNTTTGVAQFNSTFSNPASLDAYSLRVDHKLTSMVNLFGRYSYSPSEIAQRGAGGTGSLSTVETAKITTQTATIGSTWAISPFAANDFRFNYSRTNGSGRFSQDNFGGAVPLTSLPFPDSFSSQNGLLQLVIFSLSDGILSMGSNVNNIQRQINMVDGFTLQRGSHALKFGVDYRRLSPIFRPYQYSQFALFLNVPAAASGGLLASEVTSKSNATFLLQNLGAFAQDTWRLKPRVTVTYGLRWDIDFSPSSLEGAALPAVTGYNLNNLSGLALAPAGTPPFKTNYGDLAPRVGLAYQISENPKWGTVARGGIGVFYALATSEVGNALGQYYPFAGSQINFGGTFPLDPGTSQPPPITPANLASPGATLYAFDPNLKLPYTVEWNVAVQQALGSDQAISASYIGSVGRRLLQPTNTFSPNANFASADLLGNTATSDYNALQIQFQRRLSRGFQALASYTWAHSIDDGSAGAFGNFANGAVPGLNASVNRGPSDFDIRHAFSTGLTYDIPTPGRDWFSKAVLHGWSLQNVIQVRSAPPVNVYYSAFNELLSGAGTFIRPNLVPNQPLYLYGSQFPGGRGINVAAFTPPPTDPSTGLPVEQGNLGRNALRGFGMTQWDLAVHRDFLIRDTIKLQFRAEMFDVLNHPNFAPPVGDLQIPQFLNPQFGLSTQMLGQYLGGGNVGGGGFDPLYQIGGPRSIEFALKVIF